MMLVQAGSIWVVVAALLGYVATADGKEEIPAGPAIVQPPFGLIPVDPKAQENAKAIEDLVIYVQGKGYLKKSEHQTRKLDLPTDLMGKSEAELMTYANMLYQERRAIQRRFTYHILFTLLGGIGTFVFHTNPLALPVVLYVQKQNEIYRSTLDAEWMVHQEQLSAFLYDYMEIKQINVKSLPVSRLLGSPVVSLEYMPSKSANLPIWRINKDDALPPDAKIRTTTALLKNWWFRK